jgi:futalosine hydrolase
MKHLLLAAPTQAELAPLLPGLAERAEPPHPGNGWIWGDWHIHTHVSGPGVPMVLLHLGSSLRQHRPDLLVHIGIAGARQHRADIGETVEVITDRYADIGAEDRDGNFLDMFRLGLWNDTDAAWQNGVFRQPGSWNIPGIQTLEGVTVHTIPGSSARIAELEHRFPFQLESMEGAAVFHLATHMQIPFLALRGISNFLEPRNRAAWDIPGALASLSRHTLIFLESLMHNHDDPSTVPGT